MPKPPSSPPPPPPNPTTDPKTPRPKSNKDLDNRHNHHTPSIADTISTPHHPSQSTSFDPTLPFDDSPHNSPLHFSPSKARAQAQATQQLIHLTRWLGGLLSSHAHPGSQSTTQIINKWTNEHQTLTLTNPELAQSTVAWLQETMGVNRRADERRRVGFEARGEELQRIQGQRSSFASRWQGDDDDDDDDDGGIQDGTSSNDATATTSTSLLLDEISAHLTDAALEALGSLAETAVRLGHIPRVHGTGSLGRELGQAVMEYTVQSQELQGRLEELQELQQTLSKQLVQVQTQLAAFEIKKSAAAKEAEVMHPQTAQWNRETKQIGLKIQEYRDRVGTLERSRPGSEAASSISSDFVSVEDVIEMQERVNQKKSSVAKLEERVKILHGLPPDLEASRDEVKRAKTELERLKARREELFGALADRS